MQDGAFYEDGLKHYIGRVIFIFAGSQFNDMEEFIIDILKTKELWKKRRNKNKLSTSKN
jgi:hypothetical protein